MAAETPSSAAAETLRTPVARPVRPNYYLLHKDTLPLNIDAFPPLIPHNPISLAVIAWVYIRSLFSPAKQPIYKGYFSTETRSVHIVDKATIRALWESGFFGKGTLSRSEPTWLNREKQRRGIIAGEASEDITRRRRQERAEFKKERAMKEREEIEATLMRERANGSVVKSESVVQAHDGASTTDTVLENDKHTDFSGGPNGHVKVATTPRQASSDETRGPSETELSRSVENLTVAAGKEVPDLEHLQLSLEEAFYLHFALGVLEIYPQTGPKRIAAQQPFQRDAVFGLFQSSTVFPFDAPLSLPSVEDNTFLANYAVYHHFRSLGWIVRPGTKFAVDWMLYNKGPVFSHAEFAVLTIPSSTARDTQNGRTTNRDRSWHWLHMVNRVQSQVRKSLVLAFVEMPSEDALKSETARDPLSVLSAMRVREIVLKRWIPNRNRD